MTQVAEHEPDLVRSNSDPLSVIASVLAVVTAAIISIRSLCDTVKGFQNRNSTLKRLQHTL